MKDIVSRSTHGNTSDYTVSFHYHILVNRCVSNFENYKKNWFQIMSLPVNLNRPASGTITSAMIPIHTSSPKVYVTCQNVEVETEEIRNDIVHVAEVVHDGDIFLNVFHNADTAIDEPPSDHYGDEQFWLNRLAQQTYFLDDDDDDDNDDNIYISGIVRVLHRAWFGETVSMPKKLILTQFIRMQYRGFTLATLQFRPSPSKLTMGMYSVKSSMMMLFLSTMRIVPYLLAM